MSKKEKVDEVTEKPNGKNLIKDCGKLIVIATMVVLVIGLGLLTWKKRDKLTDNKSTKKSGKETNAVPENTSISWNLNDEIKKLETRQQNNMSKRRSTGGDPLVD